MRIAMIGPFGLEPKATMRRRALPLARELATRGHAVTLIMPPWHTPAEASRQWEEDAVTLQYVSLSPPLPVFSHLAITARLLRCALSWHPDIVHCFKPKAHAGLAAWILWHLQRLGGFRGRLVIDEDDWEGPGGWNELEPYPPLAQTFFAWQERWGLRHNDAVTVASRALETLVWGLGVAREKVHYLPNAALPRASGDGKRVRQRHALGEKPVVLLYTRFFEYDVARLLRAWQRIREACPMARLLVVGEGLYLEDERRFGRLLAEGRLSESVVRAGWVSEEELPDYFAAADLALYPFDDTLINRTKCAAKLVDLLAAGVPLVADAVGQNREYIRHGETGWLVPAGDSEAMAAGAIALLHDAARRKALGERAAAEMQSHYSVTTLAKTLEGLYATLLGVEESLG